MAPDRRHRLDAATADRLLAGAGGGPPSLSELISAAAAPARADETAGEDAAVIAFIAARDAAPAGLTSLRRAAAGHRPPRRGRPRWARLLTAKALAMGLAVAAGGMALAAGTGVLPNPLRPDPPATGPVRTPGGTAFASSARPSGADPDVPKSGASPSPSLDGLCTAYLKHLATAREEAQKSPAYASLFAAAGGVAKAEAYCQARLVEPSTTASGQPSGHPTGPPSPHPTGSPPSPDHRQTP